MNKYEFMVIINPDLSEEDTEKIIELLEKEIGKNNGTIDKKEHIGKKTLAYPIQKHEQGLYLLYYLSMESKDVKAFEKRVRMILEIIRYLMLKLDQPITAEVQDG